MSAGTSDRAGAPHPDVVVLGGGLSGLELSRVLRRAGADVLVVDAAPPGGGAGHAPRHTSGRPPHYGSGTPVGARLGGRSLLWHGVTLRLDEWALTDDRWPADVRESLNAELYDEVERDLGAWAGRSLTGPYTDGDAGLQALLELRGMGPASPVPRAVRPGPDGTERAYTPLDGWASGALSGEAVELLAGADRLRGVLVAGPGGVRHEVRSRAVVLAAGTLENTRLVGQLEHRLRFAGLHDHLVQGLLAVLPAAALGLQGPRREAFVLVRGDGVVRSNLFVRTRALPDPALLLLDAWTMSEQAPEDVGSVRLTPGPAPWAVAVHAELSPADELTLRTSRRHLQRVVEALDVAAGARLLVARPAEPRPFDVARARALASPEEGAQQYWWPLGTVDHEGGTLPLGSALDSWGRLRGPTGGYVVGPAVFPRPGAANPSLTTLALARRTAAAVLDDLD